MKRGERAANGHLAGQRADARCDAGAGRRGWRSCCGCKRRRLGGCGGRLCSCCANSWCSDVSARCGRLCSCRARCGSCAHGWCWDVGARGGRLCSCRAHGWCCDAGARGDRLCSCCAHGWCCGLGTCDRFCSCRAHGWCCGLGTRGHRRQLGQGRRCWVGGATRAVGGVSAQDDASRKAWFTAKCPSKVRLKPDGGLTLRQSQHRDEGQPREGGSQYPRAASPPHPDGTNKCGSACCGSRSPSHFACAGSYCDVMQHVTGTRWRWGPGPLLFGVAAHLQRTSHRTGAVLESITAHRLQKWRVPPQVLVGWCGRLHSIHARGGWVLLTPQERDIQFMRDTPGIKTDLPFIDILT
jgi:hypothetical protein